MQDHCRRPLQKRNQSICTSESEDTMRRKTRSNRLTTVSSSHVTVSYQPINAHCTGPMLQSHSIAKQLSIVAPVPVGRGRNVDATDAKATLSCRTRLRSRVFRHARKPVGCLATRVLDMSQQTSEKLVVIHLIHLCGPPRSGHCRTRPRRLPELRVNVLVWLSTSLS